MSDESEHFREKEFNLMTAKEKRGAIIGGLCVIVVGLVMIVQPDAAGGAEASGRHFILRTLFIWIWGVPAGIIAILLGGASIWTGIKAVREDREKPPGSNSKSQTGNNQGLPP
jgi:hypothetical protein